MRGYAVLTAFNQIKEKEIHFRVSGVELPGAHADDVRSHLTSSKSMINNKKIARQTTNEQLQSQYESQEQVVNPENINLEFKAETEPLLSRAKTEELKKPETLDKHSIQKMRRNTIMRLKVES